MLFLPKNFLETPQKIGHFFPLIKKLFFMYLPKCYKTLKNDGGDNVR
jgi:hypothetical protein